MDLLYRWLLKPLLFLLPAETAHGVVATLLIVLQRMPWLRRIVRAPAAPEALGIDVLGRHFAHPVGLAAGFDKRAEMYDALGALGFAFVEVGTVTAEAQPGNPRPRLFRLPRDRALVNRMGFNNPGAHAVAHAIESRPQHGVVLGINLGKSKVTPLERAADDYGASARVLGRFADYVVVNVSSPNTPGLRSLQSVEALAPILAAVQRELCALQRPPPLLVKIAPDLADEDIDAVVDLAREHKLAGVIAVNTTVARDGLGLATSKSEIDRIGAGGLSGAPLRRRALEVIRRVYARAGGSLVVIGVGGIASADDAWEAIRAGASLVQLYSGLIYEGPGLPERIVRGLAMKLREAGMEHIADAVGTDAHAPAPSDGRPSSTSAA